MTREYALVIMDKQERIIDRFNLTNVFKPTGNGFELELSTIGSDIEDIITAVKQKKSKITMRIYQTRDAYQQANALSSWIQKYSTIEDRMFLEYNDTKIIKYCGGKVTKLDKTERDNFQVLDQYLEFQATTPFFIRKENKITIMVSSKGKSYPFTYPYRYGRSEVQNNEINNPYILDIPIIITIDGAINNPTIDLLDEQGSRYSRVQFIVGTTIAQGEKLIINSAQKKIYKITVTGEEIDYRPKVSPVFDTFLLAKNGKSSITVNMSPTDVGDGFKLTGGWRQYTL